jgi:NAD-dependent dihydropyrimidine dehydrogenase PreA subunit
MRTIATMTGEIRVDEERCTACATRPCADACPEDILKIAGGSPVLAKDASSVRRGLCRECLACELACLLEGAGGLQLVLPIEGLEA